jgi:hypothetical protein
MQGWLVWLFPPWWRRRHGAAYRALLEGTSLTPSTVIGVVEAAARAWADPRRSRLTFPRSASALLTRLPCPGVRLLRRVERHLRGKARYDVEWRVVQFVTIGYAVLGLFLARRGHRVVGTVTTAAAVLAFLCQMSILVPGWQRADLPIRFAAMWFMALACWAGYWAAYGVHDPRRHPRPAG